MYKSIKELMTAASDKFRGYLGTADKIATQDFPAKIDAVYTAGRKSAGGGASDPAAEAVMALINKVGETRVYLNSHDRPQGVFYSMNITDDNYRRVFVIIPECVTEMIEGALDTIGSGGNGADMYVLSLPTVPPTADWFGNWSFVGENCPPIAIYVPDESVEAYKVATNWAEFEDLIKPMSELTEAESEVRTITWYHGEPDGLYSDQTAIEGMTWGEWINSEYNPNPGSHIILDDGRVIFYEAAPLRDLQTGLDVLATDVIKSGCYYLQ